MNGDSSTHSPSSATYVDPAAAMLYANSMATLQQLQQQQQQHQQSQPLPQPEDLTVQTQQQPQTPAQWQQPQQAANGTNSYPATMLFQNSLSAQFPPPPGTWPQQTPPGMNVNSAMGMNWFQQMQQMQQMLAAFSSMASMGPPVAGTMDEELLARVLHGCSKTGKTYRQAIDTELNGVNQHPAHIWKDYYLDNTVKINAMIARLAGDDQHSDGEPSIVCIKEEMVEASLKPKTVRRPNFASLSAPPIKASDSVSSTSTSTKRASGKQKQKSPTVTTAKSLSTTTTRASKPAKRTTMNSLSMPIAQEARVLTQLTIPTPPSRSPTPPDPSRVIMFRENRAKFTDDDDKFFIKFIQWELKRDPSLRRKDLAIMLHAKAPHHTAVAWDSYWNRKGDLPNLIADSAKGELHPVAGTDEILEFVPQEGQRPKVQDQAKKDRGRRKLLIKQEEVVVADVPTVLASSSSLGINLEEDPPTDEDERNMGNAGSALTPADLRMMARRVAANPDWNKMTNIARWVPFAEKYKQRGHKSWAENYRRRAAAIGELSKRYAGRVPQEPVKSETREPRAPLLEQESAVQSSPPDCQLDTPQERPKADIFSSISSRFDKYNPRKRKPLSEERDDVPESATKKARDGNEQ